MEAPREAPITRLLDRLVRGDAGAADEVLPLVYTELHQLADRHMARQSPGHTLQPTALVNEAWMRIAELGGVPGAGEPRFETRKHFFALASKAMRSILVDHARRRDAAKRGGGNERLTLLAGEDASARSDVPEVDVLALEEALQRLEERDAELARLVELRFFGGLTFPEVSEVTGMPLRTAARAWSLARAWLHRELSR